MILGPGHGPGGSGHPTPRNLFFWGSGDPRHRDLASVPRGGDMRKISGLMYIPSQFCCHFGNVYSTLANVRVMTEILLLSKFDFYSFYYIFIL